MYAPLITDCSTGFINKNDLITLLSYQIACSLYGYEQFLFLRAIKPAKPNISSASVAGSGTEVAVTVV